MYGGLFLLAISGVSSAGESSEAYRHPLNTPSARDLANSGVSRAEMAWQVGAASEDVSLHGPEFGAFLPVRVRFRPTPDRPDVQQSPRVTDILLDDLENRAPEEVVRVVIGGDRRAWRSVTSIPDVREASFFTDLDRARTVNEVRVVEGDAFDLWKTESEEILSDLRNAVGAVDGAVVDELWLPGQVIADVRVDRVSDLLSQAGVAIVDTYDVEVLDVQEGHAMTVLGNTIDGVERSDMLQTFPIYKAGYTGGYSNPFIIVQESGAASVHNLHYGLNGQFINCPTAPGTSGSCTNPQISSGLQHATSSAAIAIGSIMSGQDGNISSPTERLKRSGVAYGTSGIGAPSSAVLGDLVASTVYESYIITKSSSGVIDCLGTSAAAQEYNSYFEAGKAIAKSGSNAGGGSCTVRRPGDALGVFTMSAYQVSPGGDYYLYPNSSQGGAPDGRVLIDMAGPTRHQFAYPYWQWPMDGGVPWYYGSDWGAPGGPPGDYNATSGATPAVAGAMALIRDWWHHHYGAAIDDPAMLYTVTLLMGDRTYDNNDSRLTEGFHNRWGAGRLRLRQFDASAWVPPYAFAAGVTCVDDGTDVYINMASTNSDVDTIRVVAWTYDHNHDSGGGFAEVGAYLYYNGNTHEKSIDKDHKQRIHLQSPPVTTYQLLLRGMDVATDIEGCGTDSAKVYWAWFAESDARPPSTPLEMVRPENP